MGNGSGSELVHNAGTSGPLPLSQMVPPLEAEVLDGTGLPSLLHLFLTTCLLAVFSRPWALSELHPRGWLATPGILFPALGSLAPRFGYLLSTF